MFLDETLLFNSSDLPSVKQDDWLKIHQQDNSSAYFLFKVCRTFLVKTNVSKFYAVCSCVKLIIIAQDRVFTKAPQINFDRQQYAQVAFTDYEVVLDISFDMHHS